jgi:hypothetical protein
MHNTEHNAESDVHHLWHMQTLHLVIPSQTSHGLQDKHLDQAQGINLAAATSRTVLFFFFFSREQSSSFL